MIERAQKANDVVLPEELAGEGRQLAADGNVPRRRDEQHHSGSGHEGLRSYAAETAAQPAVQTERRHEEDDSDWPFGEYPEAAAERGQQAPSPAQPLPTYGLEAAEEPQRNP